MCLLLACIFCFSLWSRGKVGWQPKEREEQGWASWGGRVKVQVWGAPSACVCAESLQSYPALGDPKDCSPPGSSVCGVLQARILGCHVLLRGIFRTQGSNLCLLQILHCRQILCRWATREGRVGARVACKASSMKWVGLPEAKLGTLLHPRGLLPSTCFLSVLSTPDCQSHLPPGARSFPREKRHSLKVTKLVLPKSPTPASTFHPIAPVITSFSSPATFMKFSKGKVTAKSSLTS